MPSSNDLETVLTGSTGFDTVGLTGSAGFGLHCLCEGFGLGCLATDVAEGSASYLAAMAVTGGLGLGCLAG